ncbi:heme exporter protein CcmB [Spartinivicinus marinus]|uniref:heme exporter protein CcmB n=1 Tax=Spartinivicinus marinus TaxID=2994442 RepID=UPI003EC133BE
MGLLSAFQLIVKRDLLLAFRRRAEIVNPLIFFLLVASLFPLGITPERKMLALIAPGVIWVAALLAVMLSLDQLFKHDYDDGSLNLLVLSPVPLFWLALAKVLVHWLVSGALLLLFTPILALMLHLPDTAWWPLLASLLLGTPLLSLIGAIGAALTVGLKKGGVLLSLLVLPLNIPVLIFGSGAVIAATQALPYEGQLLWLAVLLVLGITLAPFAIAAGLRISVSE